MGMLAMGCNFALVGATQEELIFVRNVIDKNRDQFDDGDGFMPNNGPGSVISLESFDSPADYDIGLDFCENRTVRIKSMYSQRVGTVSYDDTDRSNLLYQLVMMQIGFKFADVPFDEIMDILEKGSVFKSIECKDVDYKTSFKQILEGSLKGKDPKTSDILVQMIDPPEVLVILEIDEIIEGSGIQNSQIQIITTMDDSPVFQIGLFISK